jgi:hypothetical protein
MSTSLASGKLLFHTENLIWENTRLGIQQEGPVTTGKNE